MSQAFAPGGLEPVDSEAPVTPSGLPRGLPRSLQRAGLRLTIYGRSIRLRRLRRPPAGLWRWLAILGPGLIAGSAGNDAGGIATYSQAGAAYGYDLLWVMLVITLSLAVVQDMAARLGAATGRGLMDLIRERFGVGWAVLAAGIIVLTNGSLVVTEFVGLGAAAELFGVSRTIAVPLAAAVLWVLVVRGSYRRVELIFIAMALAFLAYPVAAVLARPDWGAVARGTLVPVVRPDAGFVALLVALLGTTISPFMQLFQQSSVVERGVSRRQYRAERADTYFGVIFSNLIAMAMIVATAATLHASGVTEITAAADAAAALQPVAGETAMALFAIGLIGGSLLAAAVLPLATAYAAGEVFGRPKGVSLHWAEAPLFFWLFTALVAGGAALALVPGVPVIGLLIGAQILNGVLLPAVLGFMLVLANDRRLMGDLANTRWQNLLGWGTLILVVGAIGLMFGLQLAPG